MLYYQNEECEIVNDFGNGMVLIRIDNPIVSRIDGEEIWEQNYFYVEVPKKQLTDKKVDIFEKQKEERKKLNDDINELRKEYNKTKIEFNKELEEIEKKRKQYKQMDMLLKYLDGKLKYAMEYCSYNGYTVGTIDEILLYDKNTSKYQRNLKLCSLYGYSKGDLSYSIHRYPDGSGNGYGTNEIYFYETYEEVIEDLKQKLTNRECKDEEEIIRYRETYGINIEELETQLIIIKAKKLQQSVNYINELHKKIEEEEKKIGMVE